jgi:hypothetical protein
MLISFRASRPLAYTLGRTSLAPALLSRAMATVNDLPPTYLPHIERTARQPRHNDLHAVNLGKITSTAGGRIRLLQLVIQDRARGIQVRTSPALLPYPTTTSNTGPHPLTASPHSKVPPRPMARRAHPHALHSRRLHHHLLPSRWASAPAHFNGLSHPRTGNPALTQEPGRGIPFPA